MKAFLPKVVKAIALSVCAVLLTSSLHAASGKDRIAGNNKPSEKNPSVLREFQANMLLLATWLVRQML